MGLHIDMCIKLRKVTKHIIDVLRHLVLKSNMLLTPSPGFWYLDIKFGPTLCMLISDSTFFNVKRACNNQSDAIQHT